MPALCRQRVLSALNRAQFVAVASRFYETATRTRLFAYNVQFKCKLKSSYIILCGHNHTHTHTHALTPYCFDHIIITTTTSTKDAYNSVTCGQPAVSGCGRAGVGEAARARIVRVKHLKLQTPDGAEKR